MNELAVNDLDELLPGREALADFLTERPLLDAFDERLDHGQRNVGFEERKAHLPQRVLDVCLGQAALAAQLFCGVRQPPGQILEHAQDITVSVTLFRVQGACDL